MAHCAPIEYYDLFSEQRQQKQQINYNIVTKNKPRLYNTEIIAYYIPWASKFAASDNKGQPDSRFHKLGRSLLVKLTCRQNNRHNRQHFNTVQEKLGRPRSCSASSLATWWDYASLSINVLYLWLILHRDWSSGQIWAEACLSAWISDWRSRTDSGDDFLELVSLSKFDTTSRYVKVLVID